MNFSSNTWYKILSLVLVSVGIAWGLSGLPLTGKVALIIFASAIWAWTFSTLDATLVALCAALAMGVAGLSGDKTMLSGLGDSFVGFVIAGFMLGGAYKHTGLSAQITQWFISRSKTVSQLFYLVATALLLLSFVIPSTSARAALMIPVYGALAGTVERSNIRKGLAILFPSVIVLSCVTSYLGAGANLMTADFIEQFSGRRISYLEWLALGGPLGAVSCYLSTWVILRLFLTKNERSMTFAVQAPDKKGVTQEEKEKRLLQKRTLYVTLFMTICWVSEPWHKIDAGMIAWAGCLWLCLPKTGVFTIKQAFKEVEWSLVVFMAATVEMSRGLSESGLIDYIMKCLNEVMPFAAGWMVLTSILAIALLSHIVITSRTARAAMLMPLLIPLGISAGYSGLLIAFFANAAMGYCLTMPVSAKPVAMFVSPEGNEGYNSKDLLRLSAWLLPIHLLLLALAYPVYARMIFN